jgi:hypothetical protein
MSILFDCTGTSVTPFPGGERSRGEADRVRGNRPLDQGLDPPHPASRLQREADLSPLGRGGARSAAGEENLPVLAKNSPSPGLLAGARSPTPDQVGGRLSPRRGEVGLARAIFRRAPWENAATALIAIGVLMLMQPFSLTLYGWSFAATLAGTVLFMIASKLPD